MERTAEVTAEVRDPTRIATSSGGTTNGGVENQTRESRRSAAREARVVAETYNGAEEEGYRWSQTATDIEMTVFVPAGTEARDVRVDIRPSQLKVIVQGQQGPQVLVNSPFAHAVRADESMWHIDKASSTVVISLEKAQDFMWQSVLEGGTQVDMQKLDTRRDISEFDSEAQAAIQRAQYDHHMKMLGQPTSQEQVRLHSQSQPSDSLSPISPFSFISTCMCVCVCVESTRHSP